MEQNEHVIPKRGDVAREVCWNLEALYSDHGSWQQDLELFTGRIAEAEQFRGKLKDGKELFTAFLEYLREMGILAERLGYYAFLRYAEDAGDSGNQQRYGLIMQAETQFSAALSFTDPEIQAIPDDIMQEYLADERISEFKIMLKKILRFKPHVLSAEEERLLALQNEAAAAPGKAFEALTDVDMDFGMVETEDGLRPLSQSSLSAFLIDPVRSVRERAYTQFYSVYEGHKNTLAALYTGSVQQDIYRAKVHNFPSSRAAALFPDNVPESVYDNLIEAVHAGFPELHRYYELRRKLLRVDELRHYDVYVPLVKNIHTDYPYEEGVGVIAEALVPLGDEYVQTLRSGLLGNWVDRYENRGKRSGAFSAGSYVGEPYILMNYKPNVLRNLFTLAHEGGHSMHSWYSVRNNPFQHYNYTIFEAEVASTFNEQLLAKYLLDRAEDDSMKAYIIGKQLDDIIATIFRQTMFAEYEHLVHAQVESGIPLTVQSLRDTYRKLLNSYFGPVLKLEDTSDLEGLRIPHFYRAFYVYKYATGLSAALALSKKVMEGDEHDRDTYLEFLKSGGSKYPIESLKLAGVDMSSQQPVQDAVAIFGTLLDKFEKLIG